MPTNEGVSRETKGEEGIYPKSETSKFRNLTAPFCSGVGLDIGAGGDPVVKTAISVDLPGGAYCPPLGPGIVQIPCDARHVQKYFRLLALDYIYSSHLLEDFAPQQWQGTVLNWCDLIRPGGYLVILVPEVELWRRALARGQPPNLNHKHEFKFLELTDFFSKDDNLRTTWSIVTETIPDPNDYSILFVARRRLPGT
jgi:hypothetical protein